ncbi:MAG: hypothetical protein U0790_12300 [Isosphaeraceae bacterium]
MSMQAFEAASGPKVDDWLVKTVGVLVAVIGAVLILAGVHGEMRLEVVVLAIGAALGLAGIDVWYAWRRVIPRIYLLDAAAEVLLVIAWLVARSFAWRTWSQRPGRSGQEKTGRAE